MPANQVSDTFRDVKAGVGQGFDFLCRIHNSVRQTIGGNETYSVTVAGENIPAPGTVGGQMLAFIASASNAETTPHLRVNSNPSAVIVNWDGSVLKAGQLKANAVYQVAYDATRWRLLAPLAEAPEAVKLPPKYDEPKALIYAGNLTWNTNTHPFATLTLTNNVTGITLSGTVDGGIYSLVITQDSTGGRTMAFPSAWKWPEDAVREIASGDADVTILTIRRVGSVIYAASLQRDFK